MRDPTVSHSFRLGGERQRRNSRLPFLPVVTRGLEEKRRVAGRNLGCANPLVAAQRGTATAQLESAKRRTCLYFPPRLPALSVGTRKAITRSEHYGEAGRQYHPLPSRSPSRNRDSPSRLLPTGRQETGPERVQDPTHQSRSNTGRLRRRITATQAKLTKVNENNGSAPPRGRWLFPMASCSSNYPPPPH